MGKPQAALGVAGFGWYRGANFYQTVVQRSPWVTFPRQERTYESEAPVNGLGSTRSAPKWKVVGSRHRSGNDMRTTSPRTIRITHRSSGEVIAEGPLGLFGITPFEGNLYIRRKYLRTSHLRPNWVPGFCIYKFLYVWLDLRLSNGTWERFVGWMYWLPNPLLPFIAFRPAVPRISPVLQIEEIIG